MDREIGQERPKNAILIHADKRLFNWILAGFASIALIAYALLATPLHDDGIDGNMIFGVPFYSDYFDLYHSFFKPIVAILLPVRYLPYPWSFTAAAFFHVLMMAAISYLTFLVARRYIPTKASALASIITLYALFTHETFMPTRPESLLLATFLGIVYLCDTWRLTGQIRYLLIASALSGVVALPSHPNASIAYIYMALFALWQWRSLTKRDWVWLIAALIVSSLVGMAIILFPDPSALITLYTDYSSAGSHRLSFITGEIRRFTFFLRPYLMLPVVLFFGTVGLTAVVKRIATDSNLQSHVLIFARQYAGILIYGLAALIGLALLPSAEWPHYLVFYVPVLAIFAALAYRQKPPGLRIGLAGGALVTAAIIAELVILATLRDHLEAWIITSLLFGVPIAALLSVSWIRRDSRWLIAALALGMIVRLGLMSADYHAYNHIENVVRERATEIGADTIMAPPQLIWAFAKDDFIAITYLSEDAPRVEFGLVALPRIWYRDRWLDIASESCEFGASEPIDLNSFVSNKLRETQWETMIIECIQSTRPSPS